MKGFWETVVRALSRDPGWTGGRDGLRGYPAECDWVATAGGAPAGAQPATGSPEARDEDRRAAHG